MWADILASLGIILASGLSMAGAIFGIITSGNAMAGASTQRPEIVTKAMIPVVLGEAVAIYGLLTSFILVGKLGSIETVESAVRAAAAGIVSGVSGLVAGVGIGYSGAAMTTAAAESPETFSKNFVAVVLAEAIAIYGLLVAFMVIAKV